VQQSLAGARGGLVSLLATDSPTAVLVVTAECARCRIGAVAYGDVHTLALGEGFAFRSVIASGPAAAEQFALLLPQPDQSVLDADSSVLRTLRVKSVPALVLVDRTARRRRVLSIDVPAADTGRLRREIITFR
jgi:hypothetical protein